MDKFESFFNSWSSSTTFLIGEQETNKSEIIDIKIENFIINLVLHYKSTKVLSDNCIICVTEDPLHCNNNLLLM